MIVGAEGMCQANSFLNANSAHLCKFDHQVLSQIGQDGLA